MELTELGRGGPRVSRAGLGLMGMSGIYGPADEAESIATIRAALDAGITLLDTGDFYGMGHNELLLRDALRGVDRANVFIQVKFGGQRDPSGAFIGHDASPVAVKNSLAYTLTRLGTDYVDLYQPARLDPRVPIEDTVGAIAEMIDAGYVRYLGLSEMGADTIRRAAAVHPVAALQIEYSLMSRGIEASILPTVRELGIGVTAYGIMSRGLLSSEVARGLGRARPALQVPPVPGREPAPQPGPADRARADRRRPRRHDRAARDRLGGLTRQRHHPADRHQAPRPPGRGAARARADPDPGRASRDRGGSAELGSGGGPLRRRPDACAR